MAANVHSRREPIRKATARPRTVLMIAYHYPPCALSSGVQRTLSFSMHLSDFGWRPVVLTVNPRAHERVSEHQLSDVPQDVAVSRTVALDAARHLAIRGRYWSVLALPDRWRSWWLTAVPSGLTLLRRHSVDAIWSTYPIATAHVIADTLARLSGLPWVADFRDPMVEYFPETNELFPKDPTLRAARLRVEAAAARRAARLVFCTDAARHIVATRYPQLPAQRLEVISNGFEERAFETAPAAPRRRDRRRVLLHSGTIYPGRDRDPGALFEAVRRLADRGEIDAHTFELRLRDPSNEDYFRRLADRIGIGMLVTICPSLTYREALAEMLAADGLLILQGFTSNPAVPAKLYEYLRAGRPILGLVHPAGETAATLRHVGIELMAELTNAGQIEWLLSVWLSDPSQFERTLPDRQIVAGYSRRNLTAQLAETLDQVCTVGAHA